jgi:diguanylate cyclase (GGDEF)-like protein
MGDFSDAFNDMVIALEELTRRLEELATPDALTGVFNRRRFDELAETELARARRYGHVLSVFILDIDHFKRVNDTHGHGAGDEVLVAFAGLVRRGVRETDHCARWGGEEFVVLTPVVDPQGAAELAERLRRSFAAHDLGSIGRVTASFGVAQYRPDETIDSLFGRADQALYRAKESGRDRAEVAD